MQGNGNGVSSARPCPTFIQHSVLYDEATVVDVSVVEVVTGSACNGSGAQVGAGDELREATGESEGSVVRKPRSLMVSFCGLTLESSGGGMSR